MNTATLTEPKLSLHLFSVKEYNRLGELGIFHEDDKVELLEGRIVDKPPIGTEHAACVDRIVDIFAAKKMKKRIIVRAQNPIYLNERSEPQPDITILRRRDDFYAKRHPTPGDIFLVIEIADSSLEYDRSVKMPIYAKAGIQEVWLVNLLEKLVEVYQDPSPEGYGVIMKRRHDQALSPGSFPDIMLSVSEILGL